MKKLIYILPFVLLAWGSTFLSSCKKDILFSTDSLTFSADTVLFDTVFTTIGSTTKRLKIYNEANKPVKVSKIQLEGGNNSPYRVNLDGISGVTFKNVTIPANDSLFMFVEVTLGENNINDPLVIEDRLIFETNGNEQTVQLAAWGQDAHFYYDEFVSGIWTDDKPHVIYNLAVVDSLQNLTITAGARIYAHKQSILYINYGSLNVEGTYDNKVVFQGDRLEPFYKDVKGQWHGIYFNHALSSTIDNAVIKNGTAGVHIFGDHSSNSDYTVKVTNTEIYNNANYGIFNYAGGRVYGENLNIHNNGAYAFFLLENGDYQFKHSQFLSYGADGNQPAIAIKNYYTHEDGITYIGNVNEGKIYNSIIYGGGEYQIGMDTLTENGMVTIHTDYANNFIKQKDASNEDVGFTDNIWNQNPQFEANEDGDGVDKKYKISSSSGCKDAGSSAYAVPNDIEGNSRNMANPDIGAYEIE